MYGVDESVHVACYVGSICSHAAPLVPAPCLHRLLPVPGLALSRTAGPRSLERHRSIMVSARLTCEQLRVANSGATVYEAAHAGTRAVGSLDADTPLVSVASVVDASGNEWLKVYERTLGEGYVPRSAVRPAPSTDGLVSPSDAWELARRPRLVWPEPPRRASADVTFTITFNGRAEAFFSAVRSVLTALGTDELRRIDSWVVLCDQGASADQRVELMRAMPWATVVAKGAALHRHPVSMNLSLALIRTRWWLAWEDDWVLPAVNNERMLSHAVEVARLGNHQVALNGAWLESDPVWQCINHSAYTSLLGSAPNPFLCRKQARSGAKYAEVHYPPAHRERVVSGRESVHALANSYCQLPNARTAVSEPLLWPLYSNQPSLNDAEFLRSLPPWEPPRPGGEKGIAVGPFVEAASFTPSSMYWLFEFELGLRFVRAGGRKATLVMDEPVRQISVPSSSGARSNVAANYGPPAHIPLPRTPQPLPQKAWSDSRQASSARSTHCTLSADTDCLPGGINTHADHTDDSALLLAVQDALATRGRNMGYMLEELAQEAPAAIRNRLRELGFRKLGDIIRIELGLRDLVSRNPASARMQASVHSSVRS